MSTPYIRMAELFTHFKQNLFRADTKALVFASVALVSPIPIIGGAVLLAAAIFNTLLSISALLDRPSKDLSAEEKRDFLVQKKLEAYRHFVLASVTFLLALSNFGLAFTGPFAPIGMGIVSVSLLTLISSSTILATLCFPSLKRKSEVASQLSPSPKSASRSLGFSDEMSLNANASKIRFFAMCLSGVPFVGGVVFSALALYETGRSAYHYGKHYFSTLSEAEQLEHRVQAQSAFLLGTSFVLFAAMNISAALSLTPLGPIFSLALAGVALIATSTPFVYSAIVSKSLKSRPKSNKEPKVPADDKNEKSFFAPKKECVGCHVPITPAESQYIKMPERKSLMGPLCLMCANHLLQEDSRRVLAPSP